MPKRRAAVALTLPGMDVARKLGPVSPQARAMCVRPGRTKRAAPAPKPWQALILAVDTAAHSGWSNWTDGKLDCSGEIDTDDAVVLQALCRRVTVKGELYGRKPVLVLEFWWGGNARTCAGLHVQCDRWKQAWKATGGAASRIVKVSPGQWRGPVLGSWSVGKKREEVRDAELSTARGIVGREDVGADEAAAILIGRWASFAPQIGDVIGERARDKSTAAWQGGAR